MRALGRGNRPDRTWSWKVAGAAAVAVAATGLAYPLAYPAATKAAGPQVINLSAAAIPPAPVKATNGAAVFVRRSAPIVDRPLSLNLHGTRFKGLRWGKTRLVEGRDYTLSGTTLTLKAATLTRLVGSRTYGVNATLSLDFSSGSAWRIDVVSFDTPVLSDAKGTVDAFRIPLQLKGDALTTMDAAYSASGKAVKTSSSTFRVGVNGKSVVLAPVFLKGLTNGKPVVLTFRFRSGTALRYQVARAGTSVTGRASAAGQPGTPTTSAPATTAPTTTATTTPTSTSTTSTSTTSTSTTSTSSTSTSRTSTTGTTSTSTTTARTTSSSTTTPASTGSSNAPLAGRIKPGVTRTGVATFYDSDGSGACSYDRSSDHMTAAMNQTDYENSNACGAYVEVRGSNGATITVRITNLCPAPCRVGQLDLDPAAYKLLAPLQTGETPITWKLVSPDLSGGISIRYKTGSSQWWCGIQAINHRNPVARLEVMVNGAWTSLPRTDYNYFLSANGAGCGAAIRVTDIYGQALVVDPLPVKANVIQPTNLQFAKR